VLDILTKRDPEHDFQDAFKNCRSAGNSAYEKKGTTSKVMVASWLKISFEQIAAPIPESMDDSLYRGEVRVQTMMWVSLYQTTQRHIPVDINVHCQHRENFRSHVCSTYESSGTKLYNKESKRVYSFAI
jgi:hypothetical protein